jgi:hypothetical protein
MSEHWLIHTPEKAKFQFGVIFGPYTDKILLAHKEISKMYLISRVYEYF